MYRFLSGTYRCNIHAHAQQHTDKDGETHYTHTHMGASQAPAPFIFTIYATKPTVIWVISPADPGSDLRYWMTRGNHIEPRYDQIRGRPLMPCSETQLDHVLTHNAGSLLIPSLLQLTFPLKDNITQLPASCWQKQYTGVWQACVFLYLDVSDRCYCTGMDTAEGHTSISCRGAHLGFLSL